MFGRVLAGLDWFARGRRVGRALGSWTGDAVNDEMSLGSVCCERGGSNGGDVYESIVAEMGRMPGERMDCRMEESEETNEMNCVQEETRKKKK